MDPTLPDLADFQKRTPVLCPECLQKMSYAANTDRYVCPTHGPCTTAEDLYRGQGSDN